MSLSDMVREAYTLHRQIEALRSGQSASQAILPLLQKSAYLETEIQECMLFDEQHIDDQVIEFALRRFPRRESFVVEKRDGHNKWYDYPRRWYVYSRSAFEVVPEVARFMEIISQFQGQGILTAYGSDIEESGIIRGKCAILPWSEDVQVLIVPVDGHFRKVNEKTLKRIPEGNLEIPIDFFDKGGGYLGDYLRTGVRIFPDGAIFRHIYEGVFIGGPPPENRAIYIGDKYVARAPEELERKDASCPRCAPPDF